jgi:hypothetical protein
MNMKDRYDGAPGKDAALANTRQRRYEAQHMGKDNFVKKQQAETDKYAGKKPEMKADMFEFNANMQNNGAWAQQFGKKLTAGLDKVAFPVDGQGDDS